MLTLSIGLIGMTLLLIAFALNLFLILQQSSKTYILLNFFGSAAMIAYSILISSWPFFILNLVWTTFAGYRFINVSSSSQKRPHPK
ncbi:MAG: CBU_0592 family membrane protein [Candidatus Woesearchaeota archaeon]